MRLFESTGFFSQCCEKAQGGSFGVSDIFFEGSVQLNRLGWPYSSNG